MLNCNVREFGAKGDGVTMDTTAVQKAIDECGKSGGGRVTLSEGRFLCGTLCMRSCVELCVEVDAVLLGSTDGNDFPELETDFWKTEYAPRFNRRCFIYAEGCHDIGITGRGVIDCQGAAYCAPMEGRFFQQRVTTISPARMVFFIGCRDVTVTDITMKYPAAGWSYWICDCDVVRFDGIKIFAQLDHPNTDGIHINSSRDVTVSNCVLRCGDDSIIIRAYTTPLHKPTPCERVTITNCLLTSRCSAIRIGWYNDYIMRDCVFSNLVMTDCNVGVNLKLPKLQNPRGSDQGDQATCVERMSFNNINIDHPHGPSIAIGMADDPLVDEIRDLSFSQIMARGLHMPSLVGRPDARLKNIRISDSEFTLVRPTGSRQDGASPAFNYIDGLELNNVRFNV